jgi:hypothetical protein
MLEEVADYRLIAEQKTIIQISAVSLLKQFVWEITGT